MLVLFSTNQTSVFFRACYLASTISQRKILFFNSNVFLSILQIWGYNNESWVETRLIEICESNDPIKRIAILHNKTSYTLNSPNTAGQLLLWYGYFSGLGHSSSSHGLSVWVELAGASLFCVGKRRYSSSSALMATLSGDSQRLNCSKALQDRQDRLITHKPKSWLDSFNHRNKCPFLNHQHRENEYFEIT